ncbi:ubiquitin-like modifier-activating enzyme 1 isoform X2 [Halichondria panicea]
MAEPTTEIDEGLYSRQLYVLGHDAMRKMGAANVLISGMKGLGIEIAKNLVLAGVKSVTIHDPDSITMGYLSSQFFFRAADVGKNCAEVSRERLAELNSYVRVEVLAGELSEEAVSKYQVVVLTQSPLDEQRSVGDYCHTQNIRFIVADTRGLFGQVFCDFGENFTVFDMTGEQPISVIISSVTKETKSVVTCSDETRHNFESGDYVTFAEVQGMTELNGCEPKPVTVLGPYTFSVGDTSGYSEYTRGGIVTQVKQPTVISFKSFSSSLTEPEFIVSDFAKWDRPAQLHLAYQSLDAFVKREGQLPRPYNKEDGLKLVELAKKINSEATNKVDEIDEHLLAKFSYLARGDVSPMQAVIGSITAQEIVKACSGKFNPIRQWFYFDALECLPEDFHELPEEAVKATDSRYDGQVAVFGVDFQKRLEHLKYFVVGAGAIGCEILKNFAMMGIGACPEGVIYVTDMDIIEKSNLNRQFLFRPWHIQKPKSTTAIESVKEMNPALNAVAHENRVGPESEGVYDDKFFEALDGVANALDNVDARLYMDRRCVYYRKSLLESGTLGTKGNVQVVIPHLTESYGSSQDPPDKETPMCTLKNFPNQIAHTLQWARSEFEGLFVQPGANVNEYLSDPEFVARIIKQQGQTPFQIFGIIKKSTVDDLPSSFDDCIVWARNLFSEYFERTIAQLLHVFPPNHNTTTGQPFWSGPKRCPKVINFDLKESLHVDFVQSAALLFAETYCITDVKDRAYIAEKAASVTVESFVPKNIKIHTTDAEARADEQITTSEEELETIVQSLPSVASLGSFKMAPLDFEKDDDSNHHMDFIVAASNLRATNYSIPIADRHKSKGIAGKIIPAIATTTSLVVGLVCLEMYKLVIGNKKIESYKNGFINLALPFFGFSEPIGAPKTKYNDVEWTLWDRFDVPGLKEDGSEMTLRDFLDYFKNQHQLDINMLSYDVSILYSFFMDKKKVAARMAMPMSRVAQEASKKGIRPGVRNLVLEICCTDANDEDAEVPYINYNFK